MARSDSVAPIVAMGSVIVGLWLMSKPDCNEGCRTIAEHLIAQGTQIPERNLGTAEAD